MRDWERERGRLAGTGLDDRDHVFPGKHRNGATKQPVGARSTELGSPSRAECPKIGVESTAWPPDTAPPTTTKAGGVMSILLLSSIIAAFSIGNIETGP